jgi:hypothetical protein
MAAAHSGSTTNRKEDDLPAPSAAQGEAQDAPRLFCAGGRDASEPGYDRARFVSARRKFILVEFDVQLDTP